MSQFKRFNASENGSYNSSDAYPEGTLTWDPSNGLRIHDGSTSGGTVVGGNTGYTRFLNRGIGSYDNGSSYDMTIAPNWDGEYPGHVSINLPSNENFGSPLQIVHNSDGGIQLITKNNATWIFDKDGNLTLPDTTVISSAPRAEPSLTVAYQTFTSQVGKRYLVDTLGDVASTSLPASPVIGDAIYFVDAYGTFSVNNLTIQTNGANIMGSSDNYVASQNAESFGLVYNGQEWRRY